MTDRKTNTRRTDSRHQQSDVKPDLTVLDRTPPNSPEAERGVLGSMLLDPRVVDDVALSVKPEHFYSPAYRRIFEAALKIHNAGKTVDVTLLIDALGDELPMLGGMQLLIDIAESVPTAANAVHYAGIVREKFQLRELVYASMETLRDVYDLVGEEDNATQRVIERAESRVMKVSEERTADQVTDATGMMSELLAMLDSGGDKRRYLTTGYYDLDAMARVLPQQVIVIAARPSVGKSCFAMNLMENLSSGVGAKTGVFITLEMSRIELAQRMLCSATGIPSHCLSDAGLLTQGQRARIVEASSALSQMPIFIDDSPSRTITDIAAVCRRRKRDTRNGGLDYVIIDYLQIIESESTRENREVQVATISKRVKRLARELNVPIFILSQLNRQTEEGKDNRPRMKHLRESGAIEQDADQIWFLHREDYYATSDYDRTKAGNGAELIVAKQRGGATGTVNLVFLKEQSRFESKSHVPD